MTWEWFYNLWAEAKAERPPVRLRSNGANYIREDIYKFACADVMAAKNGNGASQGGTDRDS